MSVNETREEHVLELLTKGMGADLHWFPDAVSVAELAETLAEVIGWRGRFVYDTTKPDGTPRKLSDVSRLQALGWQAATPLRKGIVLTYDWYCRHVDRVRHVKVEG